MYIRYSPQTAWSSLCKVVEDKINTYITTYLHNSDSLNWQFTLPPTDVLFPAPSSYIHLLSSPPTRPISSSLYCQGSQLSSIILLGMLFKLKWIYIMVPKWKCSHVPQWIMTFNTFFVPYWLVPKFLSSLWNHILIFSCGAFYRLYKTSFFEKLSNMISESVCIRNPSTETQGIRRLYNGAVIHFSECNLLETLLIKQ